QHWPSGGRRPFVWSSGAGAGALLPACGVDSIRAAVDGRDCRSLVPAAPGVRGLDARAIIKSMKTWPVALAGIFVWALASAQQPVAQKPATVAPETSIKVDVTRVNVLFTVTDKKGRFITDLGKDDFVVTENKKPQVIQEFT